MTKVCEKCGVEFEPKLERARFCSRKCIESAYSTVPVTVVCPMCGTSRVMSRAGSIRAIKAHSCCPSCATDRLEGSNNGNWRGGHRHWSPGRHGKDKDGLSWKTQRTLAWARDNFTCQHCGKVPKRKPDVHHINPWMNSLSHALDNLICLCQSCHLKEEAKIQEVWGGQIRYESPRIRVVRKKQAASRKPSPCNCGAVGLQTLGCLSICWLCWNPILTGDQKAGLTLKELSNKYALNYKMVDFILHPWTQGAKDRLNVRVSSLPPKQEIVIGI